MSTILYLSNQLVQAVEIKGKNSLAVYQEKAPEGSIINGIITDEEVFLDWIRKFFVKNKLSKKECSLVVNSTQWGSRVLELPKAGNAEIMKMISREFADIRTDDTLFTYHILEGDSKSKMIRVLAVAAERPFLKAYLQLFIQAGIEVVSIEPAISEFVRRFMASPDIQKKNCIVQILDGQEMISMLFVKGIYLYSQRNRLFSDEEEAWSRESAAVVRRLTQFATSQQVEDPIDTLFICGHHQEALKSALEISEELPPQIALRIYPEERLKVKEKAAGRDKVEFVYPTGYGVTEEKRLNFVRQLKLGGKDLEKRHERIALVAPAAVVLVICLIITFFMGNSYLSKNRELLKLQQIMQDGETASAHTTYELASANVASMEQKMEEAEILWDHLMSYPTLNTSVKDVLESCAGGEVNLEIKNFNRDTGVLSLEASAKDVRNINGFIAKLQEQEIFESVEYSGYTLVKGQDFYNIHVVCAMAESAGR
ncbi:MAG: hypothetical protein IJ409_03985 [Lachnospiraceae bacterium]|nr:hypothetical protein [Lachnospiraceae bacterium]